MTTLASGPNWNGANVYDPDGRSYRITTDRDALVESDLVLVKSYGQVLRDYRLHPEHKFHWPHGQPCRRLTRGVLWRRPVHLGDLRYIGKEANKLDDVQARLIGQLDDVVTEYCDPNDDWFRRHVLSALDGYSRRELARLAGTDRRTIDRIGRAAHPDSGCGNG